MVMLRLYWHICLFFVAKGLTRFPTSHRYKLLEPFDVTPDDVLSSQKQICVTYLPPTIGSPCNQTNSSPTLTRNEDGFDRHGFNVDGIQEPFLSCFKLCISWLCTFTL